MKPTGRFAAINLLAGIQIKRFLNDLRHRNPVPRGQLTKQMERLRFDSGGELRDPSGGPQRPAVTNLRHLLGTPQIALHYPRSRRTTEPAFDLRHINHKKLTYS